jgi:hypothetical protein
MISTSDSVKFHQFRGVVLTDNGRQTRRKDKVCYTDGNSVGHFYQFNDDAHRGIFVSTAFGLPIAYTQMNIQDLSEVREVYWPNLIDKFKTLNKIGYIDYSQFDAVCSGNGLRTHLMAHGYRLAVESTCHASTYRMTSAWVVVAGENGARRLGFKDSSQLIFAYTTLTKKRCIVKGDHIYLEV